MVDFFRVEVLLELSPATTPALQRPVFQEANNLYREVSPALDVSKQGH